MIKKKVGHDCARNMKISTKVPYATRIGIRDVGMGIENEGRAFGSTCGIDCMNSNCTPPPCDSR